MASTDAFIAHQANPRIYHDPGAEHYARLLIPILSACITQIEQKQQAPFTEDIKIFVCASQESFNTLVPRGIRAKGAMFLEKLFLSPRAFETDRHQGILTHELSHLHMIQTVGGVAYQTGLPVWFQEGLAVFVSEGGGAVHGLQHHLFYRQSDHVCQISPRPGPPVIPALSQSYITRDTL